MENNTINSSVSLDPLLDFWKKNIVPKCAHMAVMFEEINDKISRNPEIKNKIDNVEVLNDFPDVITPLMSAVFPAASFNSDIMGAINPCTFEPFYVSPEFQRLFLDHENSFKSRVQSIIETNSSKRLLNIYSLVLNKIYELDCRLPDQMDIKTIPDEKTGQDRYYRIIPDFQFVQVKTRRTPEKLSKEERSLILEHITDTIILSRYIDLSQFEFTGFTVVKALDITESQVISALERSLVDEQSIFSSDGIKLVEWRFEKAAMDHMERLRKGSTSSEMEPIIFKNVVPFYGQSDIRGSSLARNRGIQQDLVKQLNLGLDVIQAAKKIRSWPLLSEFQYRMESMIQKISSSVTSGDEDFLLSLMHKEAASLFENIKGLDSNVAQRIEAYTTALDPAKGMIYHKRKEYEESVSKLNTTLSKYLEQEDGVIQQNFPHYFEKHQTDGVDYMMYAGASMMENQQLPGFHIKNLTLWQLIIACGLAWHTEQVKPELKIPLDTCHLILVNHNPLSIRFRFDEKRFDVDGAYDVRQEIIKSRLDKAHIKGSGERLTQPGKIAVVYSSPSEGREIQQHIDFLTNTGKLTDNLETLELDDMPDVRGLKAIRGRGKSGIHGQGTDH